MQCLVVLNYFPSKNWSGFVSMLFVESNHTIITVFVKQLLGTTYAISTSGSWLRRTSRFYYLTLYLEVNAAYSLPFM